MKHYKSTGEIGQGEGVRAGVAYRLKDGSMIYIPEETDKATGTSSK